MITEERRYPRDGRGFFGNVTEATAVHSLMAISTLETIGAVLLSQLVMRAGEAASHCVRANQQQKVIPADRGGAVGLIVRCSE